MLGGVIIPGILRALQGEVQTVIHQTDGRVMVRRLQLTEFLHCSSLSNMLVLEEVLSVQ